MIIPFPCAWLALPAQVEARRAAEAAAAAAWRTSGRAAAAASAAAGFLRADTASPPADCFLCSEGWQTLRAKHGRPRRAVSDEDVSLPLTVALGDLDATVKILDGIARWVVSWRGPIHDLAEGRQLELRDLETDPPVAPWATVTRELNGARILTRQPYADRARNWRDRLKQVIRYAPDVARVARLARLRDMICFTGARGHSHVLSLADAELLAWWKLRPVCTRLPRRCHEAAATAGKHGRWARAILAGEHPTRPTRACGPCRRDPCKLAAVATVVRDLAARFALVVDDVSFFRALACRPSSDRLVAVLFGSPLTSIIKRRMSPRQ